MLSVLLYVENVWESHFCAFQVNYEKDDTEFIVIPRNENCKSDKMSIFVGVIYAYKGLLLVSTQSSFPLLSQLFENLCSDKIFNWSIWIETKLARESHFTLDIL